MRDIMTQELASLRESLDLLCPKWHFLILFSLLTGPKRFNEIKKLIGTNVSSKSLSTALRTLQENQLIEKRLSDNPSLVTRYHLTTKGKLLDDVYKSLVRWHSFQADDSRYF